jgi:hypothetical protein
MQKDFLTLAILIDGGVCSGADFDLAPTLTKEIV